MQASKREQKERVAAVPSSRMRQLKTPQEHAKLWPYGASQLSKIPLIDERLARWQTLVEVRGIPKLILRTCTISFTRSMQKNLSS